MRIVAFAALAAAAVAGPVQAWDGYDYGTGNYVEIGPGNLVRSGNDIEFYDYESGEYRNGTVEDINRTGSTVEIEIYDQETGEYRTFEMEGD